MELMIIKHRYFLITLLLKIVVNQITHFFYCKNHYRYCSDINQFSPPSSVHPNRHVVNESKNDLSEPLSNQNNSSFEKYKSVYLATRRKTL